MRNKIVLLGLAAAVYVLATDVVFTVQESEQTLVLQFGELKHKYDTAGLKFKLPFIQEILTFEKRILDYDLPPIQLTMGDQKQIIIDAYTRYRIKDVVRFFKTVKPATEEIARTRLEARVSSAVRNILGQTPLRSLLSEERSKLMRKIEAVLKEQSADLGLEIIDFRIVRAELPPANRESVFRRMNAELDRISKETRAKGIEKAAVIRADADRQATIIKAEAERDAELLRGQGEAKAIELLSNVIRNNEDLYAQYQSLQLYKEFSGNKTTLILSTDNPLLRFFNHNPMKTNEVH